MTGAPGDPAGGDPGRRSRFRQATGWLALAFALLAAWRLVSLTLVPPFTAFADQGDLVRFAGCLDTWPASAGGEPHVGARPHAPSPYLAHAVVAGTTCTPNAGAVLARMALWLGGRPAAAGVDVVDVRWLAGLYLLMGGTIAAWIFRRLRHQPGPRLAFALVLCFVVADPFNALFLPTLYTEPPGMIGLMVCLGVLLFAGDGVSGRLAGVFLFGMLLLGFARQANLVLPLLLAVVLALSVRRAGLRRWPLQMLLVAGIAIVVAQLWIAGGQADARTAQRTNAVLLTLAPQASDPAAFIRAAGLPPHCVQAVGGSFFTQLPVHPATLCPEISGLGASAVLVASLRHPEAVLRSLQVSNLVAGDWRLPYIAQIAGAETERRRAVDVKPFSAVSFADAMPLLTPLVRSVLFLVPVLAGLAVLLTSLHRASPLRRGQALLVATGGVIGAMLLVNLLGDGIGEPTRHAHLAILVLPVAWGALCLQVLDRQWAVAAAACFGVVVAVVLHVATPVAYGFPHQEGPVLRGWAASTGGVSEVRVLLGTEVLPADVSVDPAVDAFFGFPTGSTRAWRLPVPNPSGCTPLRVEVRPGPGADWLPALKLSALGNGQVGYALGCADHSGARAGPPAN